MTGWQPDLIAALIETRHLVSLPDNDFTWSSWLDAEDAVTELDEAVTAVRAGTVPFLIGTLFAPTGPAQELALSSGWANEFLTLADRIDAALAERHATTAAFPCTLCTQEAGTAHIESRDGRPHLVRRSFTGTLTAQLGDLTAVRAALTTDDARALHAVDPEFAPFYCPTCDATYCGTHWTTRDIFDGDWHDSIRGTCPNGHDRLIED